MALRLPNTGLAVAVDIGDAADIHPKNKQEVGRRLALIALAGTYGLQVEYSGPVFEKMAMEAGCARIHFAFADKGLAAPDNQPLKGFAVAGSDGRFYHAVAVIDGNTVVVRHDAVPEPKVVRYGWASNPECNLYNKAGLPAVPFRTDAPQPPEVPDIR